MRPPTDHEQLVASIGAGAVVLTALVLFVRWVVEAWL